MGFSIWDFKILHSFPPKFGYLVTSLQNATVLFLVRVCCCYAIVFCDSSSSHLAAGVSNRCPEV